PIIYDDRLREMGFGKYEGIERCFDIPDCPVNVFFKHPEEYDVPVEGGESMDELFARTGEFLKEKVYPALKEGKDILIIGHGAMNSSIICQVKNNSDRTRFWEVGIPNCKMIQVSGDEAR
nr:histidine phosphatase family protein [Lachnospiraceae bacterium]